MKQLLRAVVGVCLLGWPGGAPASNFIYKRSYTHYDAVTGKSYPQPVYLVFGDTMTVSSDAFTETFTTVTYDGFRGPKKFGSSADVTVQDFKVFAAPFTSCATRSITSHPRPTTIAAPAAMRSALRAKGRRCARCIA